MSQEPARPATELDLINWIRHQRELPAEVIVGPGDDAAALLLPYNELCVVTTDSVIENVHYQPDLATPEQIGHKAAARALSDLAAVAAHAVAIVAAVQIPRNATMDFAQRLCNGLMEVCDELGVALVGGDVAVTDGPLAVNVTAIGAAKPKQVALRSGAKAGDKLCVTGRLGGAGLGRHLDFLPRLREARWIAEHGKVHAMIDISDGLARDADHIAHESYVGVEIDPDAIPLAPAAHEAARRSGRPAVEHALYDGEDYELLFTLPPRSVKRMLARKDIPVTITVVGDVTEEHGLRLKTADGRAVPLDPGGWTHTFGRD